MRTILLIVLGLFIARNLNAQVDSLIIKLGDYGQMIVISPNLVTEKMESFGLDNSYRDFYTDFRKIDKARFADNNQIIRYSSKNDEPQNRTLSIKYTDKGTNIFYFLEDKQQSHQSTKYKLELTAQRKVVIEVNLLDDFERISKLKLDSLYLQSLEHIQRQNLKKRVPYKIFYSEENKKIDKNSNLILSGKSQDFIMANLTIGMSVIDSRIAPEWGASLEFALQNKDQVGQKFGLNYTTMYLYDKIDIYNISSYGFLNFNYYLKYNKNFSHKIGVGYLVSKTGSDFNGNTWNACFSTKINGLGFKIGGIYTKNTEGVYTILPSIGIDFGF